jgi:hypothetical protein
LLPHNTNIPDCWHVVLRAQAQEAPSPLEILARTHARRASAARAGPRAPDRGAPQRGRAPVASPESVRGASAPLADPDQLPSQTALRGRRCRPRQRQASSAAVRPAASAASAAAMPRMAATASGWPLAAAGAEAARGRRAFRHGPWPRGVDRHRRHHPNLWEDVPAGCLTPRNAATHPASARQPVCRRSRERRAHSTPLRACTGRGAPARSQASAARGRTRLDAHGVHVHAAAVQALDKVLLQHRPEPLRAWRPAPSASRAGSGSLTSTHTATAGRRAGGRAGTRDPPDYSAYLPSCTIERRRCSAGDRPRRATAAVQGRLRSLCLRRAAVPRRAAARPSLAGRQTQLARRRTSNSLSSTTTSK